DVAAFFRVSREGFPVKLHEMQPFGPFFPDLAVVGPQRAPDGGDAGLILFGQLAELVEPLPVAVVGRPIGAQGRQLLEELLDFGPGLPIQFHQLRLGRLYLFLAPWANDVPLESFVGLPELRDFDARLPPAATAAGAGDRSPLTSPD